MIDKFQREKIQARAYEIYEWRKENNVSGCALGDWLEAQAEIITDRRANDNCPKCGFSLLARNNGEMFCLREGCDWKIKAQRKLDKDKPEMKDIKTVKRIRKVGER